MSKKSILKLKQLHDEQYYLTLSKNFTKKCNDCNLIKNAINDFRKDKSTLDGFSHFCKKCAEKYNEEEYNKYKKLHNEDYYNNLDKNITKKCDKCKDIKNINLFQKNSIKKDGFGSRCKECIDKYTEELKLSHDEEFYNNVLITDVKKCCKCKLFKNKIQCFHKNGYRNDGFYSNCTSCAKEEVKKPENKLKRNNREKIRRNNFYIKIGEYISTSINRYIKYNGGLKNGESKIKYINFTIEELINYLISIFEPWMTFENHGKYNSQTWDNENSKTWTWNIDHIIPQSYLPYSSMEDENFKKCWSLDNLRPLCSKQNILDGNKRTEEEIKYIKQNISYKLSNINK